jgi:hypothetical protein
LKRVVLAVRVISSCSSVNSSCSASRSLSLLVALAACTDEFAHPLQHVADLAEGAFGRLRHRDAVVGIAHRDVHAAYLSIHALGDRQAGGVVLRTVHAQSGGQALDRLRQLRPASCSGCAERSGTAGSC